MIASLASSIDDYLIKAIPPQEAFRASWVLSVSAMDHYFHIALRDKIVGLLTGQVNGDIKATAQITLSTDGLRRLVASQGDAVECYSIAVGMAEEYVSRVTLQRPQKIQEELAKVGVDGLWDRALGKNSSRAWRDELDDIVERRNAIAHRSDFDPLNITRPKDINSDEAQQVQAKIRATLERVDPILYGH